MNRLVFAGSEYGDMRAGLLSDSPLESAGAIIARAGQGQEGLRFVVTDILVSDARDYDDRSDVRAVLKPAFVARALKLARNLEASLFLVHTHPFQAWPDFSAVDESGEAVIAPTIYGRAPAGPHGSIVLGSSGFAARVIDCHGHVLESIDIVAEAAAKVRVHSRAGETAFDAMYDRNIRAFGREGQRHLGNLHVGVVGVGGTGSFVVEELSRLGVGRLTLIDDEEIETTNLNRVIGSTQNDVGRAKVEVLADAARRTRPDIIVTEVRDSVLREDVARRLLDCDLVFCCTDSHGSRAVINQIAYQYLVPTFDVGVRIDADKGSVTSANWRVQMLAPGLPCLACHPLLSPDAVRRDLQTPEARNADPYIVGFQEPQPAVVSINGSATSSAVTMFLTAVTGLPSEIRHLVGRPIEGTVRAAVGKPATGCVVCAEENAFRRADSWPLMWTK